MYRSFILGLLICSIFACTQNKTFKGRAIINLNRNWSFQIGEKIEVSKWKQIHVPHTPRVEPLVVNNQWQGTCWYKKELPTRMFKNGKKFFLKFEGIMQEAEVWINKTKVGEHQGGGYLPFTIDITKYINKNKNNILLIKVINSDNSTIPSGKILKELDFNLYGGIYRNVYLISTDNVYISNAVFANKINGGGVFIHFDSISEKKALGFIKIHFLNEDKYEKNIQAIIFLRNKDKKLKYSSKFISIKPNSEGNITKEILIESPELWSPETPSLYEVEVILKNEKDILYDKVNFTTGIRSIKLNKEGFFLNGKKRFINGTNRHQEYPYVGYAISDNANYRDAYKIKQAGFDFVRFSHYPQSESFLNACDKLGLMVMNCIPGWQYFKQGIFEENAYKNIKDLVRRDRNHPSIIFWENSLNESNMTSNFIIKANKIVKEELPYKDTYTAGWIDHPTYDLFIPARQHSKAPNYWNDYEKEGRKIFIAEYGDWEYYAQNAGFNQKEFKSLKPQERTSRQLRSDGEKRLLQQALNYQEAFNSNKKGKNTIGQANWLMFDYNRGYADDLEASGISDIFRIPKFAYYFYKSQKNPNKGAFSEPMVFIASYWNKNSSTAIKIFSNCEEVALYLNDKLVERKKVVKDKLSDSLSYVPFVFDVLRFKKGKLKAVSYINNKKVAEHSIETSISPEKIQLVVDESGKPLEFGDDDIVFVYAKILDKNGNLVNEANNEISFSIKGSNEVKIMGNKKVRAVAGIATILLRTYYTLDAIEIIAKGKNLETTSILIDPLTKNK